MQILESQAQASERNIRKDVWMDMEIARSYALSDILDAHNMGRATRVRAEIGKLRNSQRRTVFGSK